MTNGAERGSVPEQVNSMDGNLQYSTGALSFPDTAGGGTFYLTYCNQPVDAGAVLEEGFGYNWIASIPRMEARPNGQMWVLLGGRTSTRFVSNGSGAWDGADGIRATISTVVDGGDTCYLLTGTNGNQAYFHAYGLKQGQLKRIKTPAQLANWWFYRTYAHSPDGRLVYMAGEDGLTWAFTYLTGEDPNAGKTQSIVVYKHFGEQGLQTELARVEFEYYDAFLPHGTLGDLKYMRMKRRGESDYPTAVTYFRYYRGVGDEPPPHNVKFIVGPASYEQLLLAAGSPGAVEALPDDGTGSLTESGNFEYRVEYDQLQRVTKLLVGWGATCGCSGSGTPGTYFYSEYQTRPGAEYYGYGTPVRGVKRTNPDGSLTWIEVDNVGAVITEVVQVAGGARWATRHGYNSSAERTAVCHPSACDAGDYVFPSWDGYGVTTKDATGRIDLAAYDTRGRILSRSVKNGLQGTPTRLEEFEYSDVLANGGGRYVYEHTVYYGEYPDRVASATTAYSYEFHSDDIDHLKKVTTKHPDVTKLISQTNVTSSVEHDIVVENFEAFLLAESTDEEGVKTRTHRDFKRGLTVKQIADYGQGRLNLTTAWQYDDYGSATAITTPAGRKTRVTHSYLLAGSTGGVNYPRRLVTLTHDHVDAVRTGMSHVLVEDLDGRVVESADAFCPAGDTNVDDDFNPGTAAAPVLTIEEAFVAGQLCNRRSIEYTSGLKTREYEWTDAENAGAVRHVTEYGYDTTGELARIEDKTGTIRGFVRDARGRIAEVKVGTDDTEGAGNMVTVETRVYDWSDVALHDGIGDGLLTKVTSQVNDIEERVVRYGYDFRGRRTWRAMRVTGQDNWPWPWDVTQYELDLQGRELTRVSLWAVFSGIWDSGSWLERHSDTMPQRLWKYALGSWHDERGRVYEERSQWTSMTSTPAPGKQYKRTTWHDTRGLVVKRREPGAAWTKFEYDGPGRQVAAYHGFDSDEADGDYAAAKSVTGDTVVKEQRRLYDGDGAVILQRTYERKADDTYCPAGALSAALSYCAKNYVATWYDEAGRVETVVDYGDNGGTDMTQREANPPARSDTALRTDYAYHFGTDGSPLVYSGQPANTSWVTRTDPAEKNHVQVFDNLSRSIRELRNHQDGTPSTTNSDSIDYQNDITTAVEYDAAGRVSKRIAFDYAAGLSVVQQVTAYVYGVTLSDAPVASALCSNELVRSVKYGQGTGEPYAQEILLAYNRLGQRTSRSARDCATGAYRTKRSFKFDNLGRLLADSADEIDAGLDGTVRSIGYAYDSAHRMAEVSSYSGVNRGGTVLNIVTLAYTKEGNLEQSLQDHGGGWSKAVDYTYSDDGGAFPAMRLSRIDYPVLGTLRRQVEFTRDG
ncbi:MAG TPA: hypothetical protein DCM87_15955, partial [Planctomycetes bacterium]|nr:hypothetical protein [Planctomycetota bacterium]